ncbi:unnamed protein product [Eruca vesicaria subsp. sativa]|uniref:Uncharacterized protein n=1 Tax=Eruca vesicaria subsp. sativa TaxID=29727 RepID=A0ABC8LVM8_ERUVS|nr:unnamed protein product [Eruca vesicaria subsp. sativa]
MEQRYAELGQMEVAFFTPEDEATLEQEKMYGDSKGGDDKSLEKGGGLDDHGCLSEFKQLCSYTKEV